MFLSTYNYDREPLMSFVALKQFTFATNIYTTQGNIKIGSLKTGGPYTVIQRNKLSIIWGTAEVVFLHRLVFITFTWRWPSIQVLLYHDKKSRKIIILYTFALR